GKYRPGHFQGVCRVVHKLLDIVKPQELFLGQKDYQQCIVIRNLVQILDYDIKVTIGETYREPSGLAMSSSNLRLSDDQKQKATTIYKTLIDIKQNITNIPITDLESKANSKLLDGGFHKIDYVSIADADTLMPAND